MQVRRALRLISHPMQVWRARRAGAYLLVERRQADDGWTYDTGSRPSGIVTIAKNDGTSDGPVDSA